jgi:hypothetical protein
LRLGDVDTENRMVAVFHLRMMFTSARCVVCAVPLVHANDEPPSRRHLCLDHDDYRLTVVGRR